MGESFRGARTPIVAAACLAILGVVLWQVVLPGPGQAGESDGGRAGVLIASASSYPDGQVGKEIAVLTTHKKSLRRMWNRFELPGSPPVVNFELRRVLFAGTGVSGSCPEEFRHIERGRDRNILKVELHTAWGPDCTSDWRGHTFVIGAGPKHFPRGEFEVRIGKGKTVTVERR